MKRFIFPFSFLLALFGIFCLPNFLSAQSINFYSQIDDAGDWLAVNLTTRYLQDYPTFEGFWKHCRAPLAWLDATPMDENLLIDLSQNNITSFQQLLQSKKQQLSSGEFVGLTSCLVNTYKTFQKDSYKQQEQLTVASNVGIFMDGDTKNSDFDIIKDIDKINEIIFAKKEEYRGQNNKTADLLKKFLQGKKPQKIDTSQENQQKNTKNNNTQNSISKNWDQKNNSITVTGIQKETHTENNLSLGWKNAVCTEEWVKSIDAMTDENFYNDLAKSLSGKGNMQSVGSDYSERSTDNFDSESNLNENQNAIWKPNTRSQQQKKANNGKDFFHKLPCNGVFCITVNFVKWSQDALVAWNDTSIEGILDAHIKKMDKVSYSDLSAQKMTKNSFQLPFLNIKFKDKVAGWAVYMHTLPQVKKQLESEETPEKKSQEFEEMMRCAMIEAGLWSDENTNGGAIWAWFRITDGHVTTNIQNATLPVGPIDHSTIWWAQKCVIAAQEIAQKKQYQSISTQADEIYAFSNAMLDIIDQILDTETRLDTIKRK